MLIFSKKRCTVNSDKYYPIIVNRVSFNPLTVSIKRKEGDQNNKEKIGRSLEQQCRAEKSRLHCWGLH